LAYNAHHWKLITYSSCLNSQKLLSYTALHYLFVPLSTKKDQLDPSCLFNSSRSHCRSISLNISFDFCKYSSALIPFSALYLLLVSNKCLPTSMYVRESSGRAFRRIPSLILFSPPLKCLLLSANDPVIKTYHPIGLGSIRGNLFAISDCFFSIF